MSLSTDCFFYSEMLFEYGGTIYEVFIRNNKTIVFCSKDMSQEYESRQDFENKANIDGVLLRDLWDKVEKPSFMYCG